MGLKEDVETTTNNSIIDNNNHRWSHPPKKKWIHCYMSVEEEKRSKASELKTGIVVKGSADPHVISSFTPSHANATTTVFPLDRRGGISVPSIDDRHSHRRRGHQTTTTTITSSPPTNNGRASSPHLTPTFPLSPPLLSSSPSSSSSSPTSSVDFPLGIVNNSPYRTNNNSNHTEGGESQNQSAVGRHLETPPGGARIQPNGFTRPNGLGKPISPSSRDYDDQYSKDEAKKRSGSTPSREVHNKLEKNRRAHLKECFETLRRTLPCMEDKKISNQTILKAAYRYIANMLRREKEAEIELEELARQKISNQQQLALLKKELLAKWEHIDFDAILPDMASLEQNEERNTKSTTTASEQPDFEEEVEEEEDSPDSSAHSNSLTITTSPELKLSAGFPSLQPVVELTSSSSSSPSDSEGIISISRSSSTRELYQDPNQPLNLSTNTLDVQRITPHSRSQQHRMNGEWPLRRNSHYATPNPFTSKEKLSVSKPLMMGRVYSPGRSGTVQVTKLSSSSASASSNLGVNVGRNQAPTLLSTKASHISPISVQGSVQIPTITKTSSSAAARLPHLVKSGTATAISHVPSIAKVVTTTFPNLSAIPQQSGTTVTHIPHHVSGSTIGHIHTISSSPSVSQQHVIHHQDSNIQTIPSTVTIGSSNLTHVPHLSTVTTAVARVSTSNSNNATVGGGHDHHHSLPIVGGNGIQHPAQLVTSGVHLSGASGTTILGQPAIQVITPEGYKLLPADHTQNGAKPLAITLTHPGLEHLTTEDGKSGPVTFAVSKNGLSALHLTMPTSARALSNSIGNSVPVTSVPLNLTVGGSGTAVKVTQTGSSSILPSYLPLTHANGITQLVHGMSLVGPLVVSQSQRGIMMPTNGSGGKGILKGVSGNGVPTSVPLVPAQYASTIAGGLVNSVVVVSAPTVVGQSGLTSTASVVTSTVSMQPAKH